MNTHNYDVRLNEMSDVLYSDGTWYHQDRSIFPDDHPLTVAYVDAQRRAEYCRDEFRNGWDALPKECREPASAAAYFMWNTRPDGYGWNKFLLLQAEYEVRKESTFPGSGYWEVVTVDHPQDDPATYGTKGALWQHAVSCSTEEEAYRQLARIQDAQFRLRRIAAMLELTKDGKHPHLAGMVGRQLSGRTAEHSLS